eukprot:jgi/Mesen1/6858/ME000351S05974
MVEHMAMFPVDTVKTRLQMLGSTPAGSLAAAAPATVRHVIADILKREGPLGLYRGIGAMGLGAGPAHAIYFAVYELAKEELGGNAGGFRPAAHATAGALATLASDAVFTPMDVVKQRLQLRRSPYRGVWDCCHRVLHEEGVRAFFTSYKTTVIMNVPFTAVHFATYEAAKQALHNLAPPPGGGGGNGGAGGGGEEEEEGLLTHVAAGGAAGALASAVTNPLDVVKTRLQCQGVCGAKRYTSGSVVAAMRDIVQQEGAGALLRGLRPRVLFHTPAAAICWSTYEAGKKFLQAWNERQAPTSSPSPPSPSLSSGGSPSKDGTRPQSQQS